MSPFFCIYEVLDGVIEPLYIPCFLTVRIGVLWTSSLAHAYAYACARVE